MVTLHAALRHVKRDVGGLLDPDGIHAACETRRHDWWPGPLDPAATLGLMLRQVAEGNVSGGQVVRMAGGTFTESAWCQARQRLPLEVLQEVGQTSPPGCASRRASPASRDGSAAACG